MKVREAVRGCGHFLAHDRTRLQDVAAVEADLEVAHELARAFLAGPLTVPELMKRGQLVLGERPRWLRRLAKDLVAQFADRPRPRQLEVCELIYFNRRFQRAFERATGEPEIHRRWLRPAVMVPHAPTAGWKLPSICTPINLAAWLGVTPSELNWLADPRGYEWKRTPPAARRYRYHIVPKGDGYRVIEAPKRRLADVQRQILRRLLDRVPPHEAAHGFRSGCSPATFAAPHIGQRVLLKLDLQGFFPKIPAGRVAALFRSLGYPEPVADLLSALCTNIVPADVWPDNSRSFHVQCLTSQLVYQQPHLPQGASTSPAIANLCAFRLDLRLAALAKAAGATYTRYADDLAFSGGETFHRSIRRFRRLVMAVVEEEDFCIQHRKTRVMTRSNRQQAAGVVVNQKLNVSRASYDRLKAILHNCRRHGPGGQNRGGHSSFRAHLLGRISHVTALHPKRGEKLRAIFAEIDWPS